MKENGHRDEHFLRKAIDLAEESAQGGGGPFGALVVKDDRIVAEGTNRVTAGNDPTAHAEIVAIRRACEALDDFQLAGCTLYASCEPCPMCLGAIYWARPERVIYAAPHADATRAGFDDSMIYDEIDRPPAERRLPMRQLLREEAQRPFRAWADNEERVAY
jgi:tRNA(Arg) A34 adenosine deaminase TadA